MENKAVKTKNKLAAHFRNINIFFIILILIAVSAVCISMIDDLTDNASRDYVRFNTTEAVGVLGMLLNQHRKTLGLSPLNQCCRSEPQALSCKRRFQY